MALAARGLGARIDIPTAALAHAWCFGEDQGRYVVATADPGRVLAAAAAAGVAACTVGAVTADANLKLAADDLISVGAAPTSGGEGKKVSVRLDHGGREII